MSFFSNPSGGSAFGSGNTNTSGGAANPTPSAFGSFGGASGGLFGGGGSQTSGNLFGANNATASTTPAAPTGNLFGATNNASSTAPAAGGNLFGAKPAATAPSTGNLFGGGANTATAPPTANAFGNLFGGASNTANATTTSGTAPGTGMFSGFNLPKTGETKPAAAGGLSSLASAAASATPAAGSSAATPAAAPATGGLGLFGQPAKPAAAAGTTTTPNLFGGGLFGAKPAESATPAAGSSTSTTTPASGLFGNLAANKDAEKKDGATPAAPQAGGLFGAKPAEKKADGAAAPASTTTSAAPATGAPVAFPPPSMLRGKSIDEIVNRWTSELEVNVREFNKFAEDISVWDRALIENGNNIAALFSHILAAEKHQKAIDETLDHVEQQQKDLSSTLDAYEKASQELLGNQGRTLDTGPADNERDKNYMLATDLNTHLDDLSGSLSQMIESVNSLSIASKPTDSANDPMSQISQILSSHLESLQWIDGAVREVEGKASDVEKRLKDTGYSVGGSKSRGFGMNR